MSVENWYPDPIEAGQVVREIIPGGDEEREYRLYPNNASARITQRLNRARFIPNFLVELVDDSVPIDRSRLDKYATDEHALPDGANQPGFLHQTVAGWKSEHEEVSRAA